MANAPHNPATDTAKPATEFNTWLGSEENERPAVSGDEPTYVPLTITRSAGGRSLDNAVFSIDLGRREDRLVDIDTPTAWNRQIEVRITTEEDSDPIFWGMLAQQSIQLAPGQESATAVARIDPYLFGNVLTGMIVHDKLTDADAEIEIDPVFNPLVDGVIVANRSQHLDDNGNYYVWVHPEAVISTTAETYQDETARDSWTLASVVRALCWMLNPDEEYVANPTFAELSAAITNNDPPAVQNLYVRRGQYLSQCLDAVLEPHGFGWYLKIGQNSSGESIRKIAVFKRGVGDEKQVFLQRPEADEDLDLGKTNLAELSHDLSVADLANRVYAYGSQEEREVTIPLYRGWVEADDALTPEDLDKSVPAENGGLYDAHPMAWRLFVANESGDYNGLRTEITGPLDLSTVFSTYTPHRRRLGDMLQLDATGKRMNPILEWYNPDDEVWEIVPPGSYSILHDQIGVMFNGSMPPDDIASDGEDVALRITGTVTGDSRLSHWATRRDQSPNGLDVVLFLDVSDRFHDRQVQVTGDYGSQWHERFGYGYDEMVNTEELQAYAEAARDTEDAANIQTTIRLHGIHRDYEIGDLITNVDGRNIGFDRMSASVEESRYLQITAITFDTQRQETILGVQLNKDEGYQRDAEFGAPFGKKFKIV